MCSVPDAPDPVLPPFQRTPPAEIILDDAGSRRLRRRAAAAQGRSGTNQLRVSKRPLESQVETIRVTEPDRAPADNEIFDQIRTSQDRVTRSRTDFQRRTSLTDLKRRFDALTPEQLEAFNDSAPAEGGG